jgi:CRP/FNR family transcriptional regulator
LDQGTRVFNVYCLISGVVKVTCIGESGKESIIDLCRGGTALGIAPAILDSETPFSVETLTSCRFQMYPAGALRSTAKASLDLSLLLQQVLAQQLTHLPLSTAQVSCENSMTRLIRFLERLGRSTDADSENWHITPLPLKRYEIAQLIGVTPEHVSRLFRQLKEIPAGR